ncbi:MAG TPA: Uma2 family endonuclease [Ktedonobacteraceae bacterium]|jgi:Uma2 family endonuclease
MAFPHEHWISPEEYLEIDRASDLKYEYDNGHIYAMAGGTQAHARIAYNMANLLDAHLTNKPCRFFQSDVKVQVAEDKYYYPDVTVTCNPEDIKDSLDVIRAPRLIVEVLSPGTEYKDRGTKLRAYQACDSVEECILISTRQQTVEIYRRLPPTDLLQIPQGDWAYRQYGPGEKVELISISLTFPIEALYRLTDVPEQEID